MAGAREPLSFAQQLDRLEEIVRRLETQELDLDEALKLFEEGIERLREAGQRLTAAEAQVKQVLSDKAGNLKVEDFDGYPRPRGLPPGRPRPCGCGPRSLGHPGRRLVAPPAPGRDPLQPAVDGQAAAPH